MNAAGKYGTDLTQYSDTLAKAKLPVSDSTQKQLADATTKMMQTFHGQWSNVSSAKVVVDDAEKNLNAIYGDATLCRATVESLPREALAFVDWSGKQLHLQAESPTLLDLVKATQDCFDVKTIGAELDAGATELTDVSRRASALHEAWVTFCERVAPSATAEEVNALISADNWQGLVELIAKKQPRAGTGLLSSGAAGVAVQSEPPSTSIVLTHSVPVLRSSILQVGTGGLNGSEGEVYRLNEQSEWYAVAQTVLYAFFFVFGIFAFYEEAWVGTHKEMLAIFILAFSVDLTADGVISALKR